MTESTSSEAISKPNRVDLGIRGKKCLLVASTGGHLAQLDRIAKYYGVAEESIWLTFPTPQSQSLLDGRHVQYVGYVRPRDWLGVLRAFVAARRLIRRNHFDVVVSTGAGLALAALPYAALRSVRAIYVESVSRIDGPSLTGRILAKIRRVSTFTQHIGWSNDRWRPTESVLSTFKRREVRDPVAKPKIFVTLGTIVGYRFDAAIDAVLATGLCNSSTVWQVGETAREGLPGVSAKQTSAVDFERAAREADVVITHAGVGTIMQLLEMGVFPVVLPRSVSRGEHVDDHQLQIASYLHDHDLGLVRQPALLSAADVVAATRFAIEDAAR